MARVDDTGNRFIQDYYPFGMIIESRTSGSESHRYGFNGKENDSEIKGKGNSVDFGARIYDGRLGRWGSLDPLANHYPHVSPYVYAVNSPIGAFDPDGKKVLYVNGYYNTGEGKTPSWIAKQFMGTEGK